MGHDTNGSCATIDEKTMVFSTAQEKFNALAAEWLDSQSGRSRIDYLHPAHLQIIGMGQAAIPFLLQEIKARSGHWFQAIRAIVGTSPVLPEAKGDFEAVTRAWLRWGVENGYDALEDGQGAVDAATPS
jgi:hypothetical protein